LNNNLPSSASGSNLAKPRNFQIGPLLLLTALFFLNFIARVVYAPLLPEIESELQISHAAAGSLFFMISVGYFISLLGSGWVAARLTHRNTIILSSMIVGLALIGTALSTGLWAMRAALLILGLAAGLYLPSGIATLTDMIDSRHWGKAIAVHEMAPNLGFIAAPIISELLLLRFHWRGVPVLLGIGAILIGLCFARFGRGGDFSGKAPDVASFKSFLTQPSFWIMVTLFGMGISSTLGVYTMLPLYLVAERSIDRNLANTLVAMSRISSLFMAFAGGWAVDRFGPPKTLVTVFLLAGLSTISLGLLSGSAVIAAVFVQPLLAVCFFPAGFAALSRFSSPETRNIAVALTVPIAFIIGGGGVPAFIGWMGDRFSFAVGIALVGGFILSGALLSAFLKSDSETSHR
jgi:NNP family nitrate/nitrite transporter-like MFS transporter